MRLELIQIINNNPTSRPNSRALTIGLTSHIRDGSTPHLLVLLRSVSLFVQSLGLLPGIPPLSEDVLDALLRDADLCRGLR